VLDLLAALSLLGNHSQILVRLNESEELGKNWVSAYDSQAGSSSVIQLSEISKLDRLMSTIFGTVEDRVVLNAEHQTKRVEFRFVVARHKLNIIRFDSGVPFLLRGLSAGKQVLSHQFRWAALQPPQNLVELRARLTNCALADGRLADKSRLRNDVESDGFADISEAEFHRKSEVFLDVPQVPKGEDFNFDPCPIFGGHGLARDFVGSIGLLNVAEQQNDADQGDRRLKGRDYEQPPSPVRHLPLGIQIVLGALFFVAGVYGFFYAVGGSTRRLPLPEAVAYALLSGGLILTGIAICFAVIEPA
jgi:hypothetical protein